MTIGNEIEALAARVAEGLEDAGQARLTKAHVKRTYAEALIRQVSARHGVAVAAVLRKHEARQKPHVVSARAQIAALLYEAEYSYPEIARLLAMSHHSQAMRARQQHIDRLAGADVTVDIETGRIAQSMIRKHGLTVRQAAERLDVSPLRLKARLSTLKGKSHD